MKPLDLTLFIVARIKYLEKILKYIHNIKPRFTSHLLYLEDWPAVNKLVEDLHPSSWHYSTLPPETRSRNEHIN